MRNPQELSQAQKGSYFLTQRFVAFGQKYNIWIILLKRNLSHKGRQNVTELKDCLGFG